MTASAELAGAAGADVGECVRAMDWSALAAELDAVGCVPTGPLLTAAQCQEIAELYGDDRRFRSTPLLLRYRAGDWNALHRDLYGELVFPLQVVIGLDAPGVDYTGGEFLLVEQRMRAQSRGGAHTLPRGHALIFTTRDRPTPSVRGWSASPMRHGVSTVRTGERHTLGLIFHDAA
nr:2OG-Fe(II) oxygenase [Candidatus Frankia alpina]